MNPLITAKLNALVQSGGGRFALRRHAQDLMDGVSNLDRYVAASELTRFFDLSQRAIADHVKEDEFPRPRNLHRPRLYPLSKVLEWWKRRHALTGYPEIETAEAIGLVLKVWMKDPNDVGRFEKLIGDLIYERPVSLARAAKFLGISAGSVRWAIRRDQLKIYRYFGVNSIHRRGTLRIPLAECIIYSNRHLTAVRLPEAV